MAKVIEFDYEAGIAPSTGSCDNQFLFGAANRSTTQARNGTYSIEIPGSGTFEQEEVENDTDTAVIAPLTEGVIFSPVYLGAFNSGVMLHQVDGKSNSGPLDTNDAIKLFQATTTNDGASYNGLNFQFNGNNGASSVSKNTGFFNISTGQWVDIALFYSSTGSLPDGKTMILYVDGLEIASSSSALTAPSCVAWHHISIGNDTANTPSAAFYLDDFGTRDAFSDARTEFSIPEFGEEIYCTFQSGSPAASTNKTWNSFVDISTSTTGVVETKSTVPDKDGTTTAVDVVLNLVSGSIATQTTSNSTQPVDDGVWSDSGVNHLYAGEISSGTMRIDFNNLDNAKTYRIEALPRGRSASNRITDFSVDNFSTFKTINGRNNFTWTTKFEGLSPSSGTLSLYVRNNAAGSTGGLGDFRLIEETSGAAPPAPSTPDGVVSSVVNSVINSVIGSIAL